MWTFAKGNPEGRESPEQTAVREVRNETGVIGRIVAELPGWFSSGSSVTKFFLMEVEEETGEWDSETQAVKWVPLSEAAEWIGKTRNPKGRARDLKVLGAVRSMIGK